MKEIARYQVAPAADETTALACTAETTAALMIDQWLNEQVEIKPLTKKAYRTAATVFMNYMSEHQIAGLTEVAVVDYKNWLIARHENHPSTAKLYWQVCRKFCQWLTRRGYIDRNPAEGLKGVQVPDVHNRDPLELDQAAAVIASFTGADLKSQRDQCVMALMICCGLRSVEIIRADFGDTFKRKGIWQLRIFGKARDTKSDSICLPKEIYQMLEKYKAAYKAALGKRVNNSSPLFPSLSRQNYGERLTTATISRLAKSTFRVVLGVDDERITCHSCRHTCADLAIHVAGCTTKDLQKNLRHKSEATTEIYISEARVYENPVNQRVADVIFGRIKKGGLENVRQD